MTGRVSVEDLLGAADWLRAYEAGDGPIGDHGACGDSRAEELLRVADWLDAEIARRIDAAAIREVVRRTGRPASVVAPVYRRHKAAAEESSI